MTLDIGRKYNIYNTNEIVDFLHDFNRLVQVYNYHSIFLQWNYINNLYSKEKNKQIQLLMYKDKANPIKFWGSFHYFLTETCEDIFLCQIDSIGTADVSLPWKILSEELLCQYYFLKVSKNDSPLMDSGIRIEKRRYFVYISPIIYLSFLFIAAVECLDESVLDVMFKNFIKWIDNYSLIIFSKYIENLINLYSTEKYVDGEKIAWLLNLKNNLSGLLKGDEGKLVL